MSIQSYVRQHPVIIGALAAVFLFLAIPASMWVQGYPLSLFLTGEMLPRLVAVATMFGIVMGLFVFLMPLLSAGFGSLPSLHRKVVGLLSAAMLLCVLILLFVPISEGDWQMVENSGESALFLDTSSIHKDGPLATFWTKLASPSWLRRQFAKGEIRTKVQIDCATMTMRDVGGGIYVKGRLRFPFEELSSGKVPSKGYGRLLYDRVC